MSKIYNIDDAEFEEIIKSIALNNKTMIDRTDPVLMFYTIAKYVFKEYASELDDKIDILVSMQNDIIDDFKLYLENKKTEYDKEYQAKIDILSENIKNATDENVKKALYNVSEIVKNLEKSYNDTKINNTTHNFYTKLLIAGNIVLSTLVLYLVF